MLSRIPSGIPGQQLQLYYYTTLSHSTGGASDETDKTLKQYNDSAWSVIIID